MPEAQAFGCEAIHIRRQVLDRPSEYGAGVVVHVIRREEQHIERSRGVQRNQRQQKGECNGWKFHGEDESVAFQ